MHNSEIPQTPAVAGGHTTNAQEDSCGEQKTAADIKAWLVTYVAELLEIEPDKISANIPLERYGLDSSSAVVLSGDLQEWLGCDLDPTILIDYPTIKTLVEYLVEEETGEDSTY